MFINHLSAAQRRHTHSPSVHVHSEHTPVQLFVGWLGLFLAQGSVGSEPNITLNWVIKLKAT